MVFKKRIVIIVLAVALTFIAGIVGYEWIEGWNFLDATYMTVITLATIGYGETHPLSNEGRIFTMFLILCGLSTVSYGALAITSLVADGELIAMLKRKQMDKAIAKLEGHFIVCGAGKTGLHIIGELLQAAKQVVVIDKEPAHLQVFHSKESIAGHYGRPFKSGQIYYLEGDASSDHTLLEAGLGKAEGIFCALPNDKDNLFVVLSARGLNNRIRIVSRCQWNESEPKFVRAGADRIVLPNRIGGLRMASEMLRPAVVSFLDVMVRDPRGYRFEEVLVGQGSPFVGKSIRQSPLGAGTGFRVLALATDNGGYQYTPSEDTVLDPGQRFIILAVSEEADRLRKIMNGGA